MARKTYENSHQDKRKMADNYLRFPLKTLLSFDKSDFSIKKKKKNTVFKLNVGCSRLYVTLEGNVQYMSYNQS